jgi:hypothetical protein
MEQNFSEKPKVPWILKEFPAFYGTLWLTATFIQPVQVLKPEPD